MTEPYIKKRPKEPILASDWNEIQRRSREGLSLHDHRGGTAGEPVGTAGLATPLSFAEGQLLVGAYPVRANIDYMSGNDPACLASSFVRAF